MTSYRSHLLLALFITVLLVPRSVFAQLDDWSNYPVSTGSTIKLEESMAYVVNGNQVSAYSAISRTWASIFCSGTPVIQLTNEAFIVRDGQVFYGYSPHSGVFSAQYASNSNASLVLNGSPQTWHNVVIDGNDIHIYFSFSGQWRSFNFQSPPAVTVGRFCVLMNDGLTVQAVSSYFETNVVLNVANATILGAYGNVGVAYDAGTTYCFSAGQNTWSKMTVAAQPSVSFGNSQPGFVELDDGASLSYFSGHTGNFSTLPVPTSVTRYMSREVAMVVDGATTYGYSALKGSFASIASSPNVTIDINQYHGLVIELAGARAYSAVLGEFSNSIIGSFQHVTKAFITVSTPTGSVTPSDIYSCLTNTWTATPSALGTNAIPQVSAQSVVMEDPNGGLWGYSGRHPSWVFEPFTMNPTIHVGSNPPQIPGTIVAYDGFNMTAFNPRTASWQHTTTAAAPQYVRGHCSAIVVHDGINAYGFSNLTDDWSQTPIGAMAVSQGAQVHSGFVFDGSTLHTYSAIAQVSTIGEFPDHWRTVTQGQRFRVEFSAEPGAESYLLFGLQELVTPTPWGSLYLDPVSLVTLNHFFMPLNGSFSLTFQMPILPPGVLGVPIHFQGIVIGPNGPYITDSATTILL